MIVIAAALLMAPAAQDPAPPAKVDPNDRVVCRTLDTTGSRLRKERVCRTVGEWIAYRQEARRHVEQIQNNRGTAILDPSGTPGGT